MTASRRSNMPRFDHAEAIALVKSGLNMTVVGKRFGVSRERIRQIVRKAGVVPQTGFDFAKNMRKSVRDLVLEGYDDAAIADLLEMPAHSVVAARRRFGLKESNWAGFAGQILAREVGSGRSVRSVCIEYDLNEETARRIAKRLGVKSAHGPHRDLSARRELIAKLRDKRFTWAEISRELGRREGRHLGAEAAAAWARRHAPELICQREA